MSDFMKAPCEHCPYRCDVKPYLTESRGIELAYHATNPYNDFPCHKTTIEDEESDEGEMLTTSKSKTCAGFLTLQIAEGASIPNGFKPAYEIVYAESRDMIDAYENLDE